MKKRRDDNYRNRTNNTTTIEKRRKKMKTLKIVVMMVALALIGAVATQAVPLADSVADYSGLQGTNNWYYLGWICDDGNVGPYNPAGVYQLSYTGANGWQGPVLGAGYPWIMTGAAHPADWTPYGHAGTNHWVVRRWVSEVAGTVGIEGVVGDQIANGGGGVNAHIYIDGVEVWSKYVPNDVLVNEPYSVVAAVGLGSNVDFVLDAKGEVSGDATNFTGVVTPEPSSLAALAMGPAFGGLMMLRRRFKH